MGSLVELARRLRPLIVRAAQSLADEEAAQAAQLYDEWSPEAAYEAGYRVRRGGRVYRALQAHTAQADWPPETAVSLWTEICETHSGAADDPIPYSGNMALEAGKHYEQGGVVYLCTRSSDVPVHHALAELTGLYVEAAGDAQ